jgi:hypothetical protein
MTGEKALRGVTGKADSGSPANRAEDIAPSRAQHLYKQLYSGDTDSDKREYMNGALEKICITHIEFGPAEKADGCDRVISKECEKGEMKWPVLHDDRC